MTDRCFYRLSFLNNGGWCQIFIFLIHDQVANKNECFWRINSLRFFYPRHINKRTIQNCSILYMTFQCVCRSSLCFWKNKFYSHFWLHQIKWRPILIKLTIASRAFRLQSRCQSIPRLFSSFNSSIFFLYLAPSYFKGPPLSITTSSRLKFVIFKIQKKN